ncbi:MAG: Gfo/Idh/MocA family oxidoreductase [Treponema sp.]|nr:Gfo/Idh/MocA family oxidoreductase [Treponema sp.]
MIQIKTAVIGLGRIASLLEEDSLREKPCTHAGAITSNKDCILTAGCDLNEERRNLFTQKWNVPVYTNAQEMLINHKPQIVVIATHPDSHYFYCNLAAKMNIPVVICEKPLADNIGKAKKIAQLAKKNNPIIITNHERRYSQDYIKAKTILEEGKLGKIVAVRATLYMGKNRRLIDQLWHDGTHLADVIMFLTNSKLKHKKTWGDKLNSRSGTAWLEGCLLQKTSHRGTEARSCCSIISLNNSNNHFAPLRLCERSSGIPVLIEIGSSRDHLVFEIEFSCKKGRLRIGNGVFEVWESLPSPYAENFRSLKNTGKSFTGATGYFANMLKDAVTCVKDPQRKPLSGAVDGLNVIKYLNSVKKW